MEISKLIICGIFAPVLGALGGCAALTSARPSATIDTGFSNRLTWAEAAKGNAGRISSGWLKTFNDNELNTHVKEALANNRSLQTAAARLKVAHYNTVPARAARLPSANLNARQSRTRNENGGEDLLRTSNYQIGLNLAWEIDLWGRLADLDNAAQADFAGAEADFRSARLSLAATTAQAWFQYITAIQLEELAKTTLISFERNQRITERNYKGGDLDTSPFDVQIGRTDVASAARQVASTTLTRKEAARSLEVLIGRYPSAKISGRDSLPTLPDAVPAGLPAELLWRRPDLAAAAQELAASAHRADAARKDLLPEINLTGGPSTSSTSLRELMLRPEFFVWSIASSLAQQVYSGGAPTAAAREALATNEVAIRDFANLAQAAFAEVESALATEHSLREQNTLLKVELAQATAAEKQAVRDYSDGLIEIISLLGAQRRAVTARTAMINLVNRQLQNRIDLHLALGGDFATRVASP